MIDLKKLREVGDKATEGPWDSYSLPCCPDMGGVSNKGKDCDIYKSETDGRYVHPITIEDAEFVEEARNNWTAMLDALEEARIMLLEVNRMFPNAEFGGTLTTEEWLSKVKGDIVPPKESE